MNRERKKPNEKKKRPTDCRRLFASLTPRSPAPFSTCSTPFQGRGETEDAFARRNDAQREAKRSRNPFKFSESVLRCRKRHPSPAVLPTRPRPRGKSVFPEREGEREKNSTSFDLEMKNCKKNRKKDTKKLPDSLLARSLSNTLLRKKMKRMKNQKEETNGSLRKTGRRRRGE